MKTLSTKIRESYSHVPLLGWLFGALVAVILEHFLGDMLADTIGLPKIPVLFGFVIILKKPLLIPSAAAYVSLTYVLPIGVIARMSGSLVNKISSKLFNLSIVITVLVHLALLYAILHLWSDISAYRVLMLKLTLIATHCHYPYS